MLRLMILFIFVWDVEQIKMLKFYEHTVNLRKKFETKDYTEKCEKWGLATLKCCCGGDKRKDSSTERLYFISVWCQVTCLIIMPPLA